MPPKAIEDKHQSVLLNESVELLRPLTGGVYVDATLGLGGHAAAILEAAGETRVIGIDQDPEALRAARQRLAAYRNRVIFRQANFSEILSVIRDAGLGQIDGIIADLGVSSMQFDSPDRGFSFRADAPLDMRMNPDASVETAADLLERLPETEIARIIFEFGEERRSRRIARWIVERRDKGEPVRTTLELAALVERALGRGKRSRIHPATRTFQALRIAVNRELEVLEEFIDAAVEALRVDGRICLITFHSLEDRIVKRAFKRLSGRCSCPPKMPRCECGAVRRLAIETRKPVVPADSEIAENPRARSAKLRAATKVA